MKLTVLWDVNISMCLKISYFLPSSSNDKANFNNNELEELRIIELDPIDVYFTTS